MPYIDWNSLFNGLFGGFIGGLMAFLVSRDGIRQAAKENFKIEKQKQSLADTEIIKNVKNALITEIKENKGILDQDTLHTIPLLSDAWTLYKSHIPKLPYNWQPALLQLYGLIQKHRSLVNQYLPGPVPLGMNSNLPLIQKTGSDIKGAIKFFLEVVAS